MNRTLGTHPARRGLVLLAAAALAAPALGQVQQQPQQQQPPPAQQAQPQPQGQQPPQGQQQPQQPPQQQRLTPEQQRALQLRQQQLQQQQQQRAGQAGAVRAGQQPQQGQAQQTIVELKPNQRAVAAIVFPDAAQGQAETMTVALAEGDPQTGATNREQTFNARNAPTGIVTHALGQQRRAGNQGRAVFIAARRGVNLVPLQEVGGDGDAMRVFAVRRQQDSAGQPNAPGVAGAAPGGAQAQQQPPAAPGGQPGDPQTAAAQQSPLGQQQQQQPPAPGQQPPPLGQQQPPAAAGAAGMPMGQPELGEEQNDVVVFVYLISDATPQRNRR